MDLGGQRNLLIEGLGKWCRRSWELRAQVIPECYVTIVQWHNLAELSEKLWSQSRHPSRLSSKLTSLQYSNDFFNKGRSVSLPMVYVIRKWHSSYRKTCRIAQKCSRKVATCAGKLCWNEQSTSKLKKRKHFSLKFVICFKLASPRGVSRSCCKSTKTTTCNRSQSAIK